MDSGASLGPYQIDRELGSGGMGKVYAATLTRESTGLAAGTTVALKVVHPHLLETEGFFKRFLREAQIGQSVLHDNVVRTLDCDAIGHDHFLVMEYVEGQTLADLQRELEKVPEELCRHVAREICKGLAAIHAAGVVHRDLKPENVLITADQVVKVMDLGVARLTEESLRLSQTGAFIGSAEYAAPEQFGGTVDHRADLHALGLLLYELSCGQHPFRADDFRGVMKRVCDEQPRKIGEVHPQLSAFFEEVVHTLLAKNPANRFASAAEVLTVLEAGEDSEWWHERARQLQAATRRPIRRIRIPRETAVYGRDEELAKLTAFFAQAKSGEGQVVLIEGEAGIGKSRLVDELIARLQRDGEDLSFLFGSYPPGGAATAAGGFSSAFREHFGEAGSAEYLPQTPLLVPAFDAVLRGEPTPPDAPVALTVGSLGTCFVHATSNLAVERPTVILIDDLHFAADEARGLFMALALAVPGHRVLLVGTMRPGVPEDWVASLSRLDHASRMALTRLGPKDLGRLLRESFRSDQLAEELGWRIARKSDGNPFFAFEIIRGLREGQFITRQADGTWVGTRVIEDIQIPSSVLDLLNARVADLSQEERDVLDVAACWGFEFDPIVVGDVVGLPRIPLLKLLSLTERKHRLVRSAGRRFVFDHHQVQEALYDGLPELLRESYHAALAEALETRTNAAESDPETLDGTVCVDLCEHYLKGARGQSALRYLEAAQTHLSQGYLQAQTVALGERALAVPDLLSGVERARALHRLAGVNGPLDVLGRRARQEEHAREAERLADEAGDSELLGKTAMAVGTILWRTSRHAEAEVACRRALELARARGDRRTVAAATGALGSVFHSAGRSREAREYFERGLALCREISFRGGEATAMGNLGLVLTSEGCLHEARECHEQSLALKREIGDRVGEAGTMVNLGTVLQHEGRLGEAREHYERALTLCREIGHREFEAAATGNLGTVFRQLGRVREAREAFERTRTLRRTLGNRRGDARVLHSLAVVLREEGNSTLAEEQLLLCLSLAEEIGDRRVVAATHLALGSLLAAAGEGDRALQSLASARDLASQLDLPDVDTLARCHLASLPGGDAEGARAALTANSGSLHAEARREAHLVLFRATGDTTQLEAAKQFLDASLVNAPADCHEAMLTKLQVNREIMHAWRAEFGDEDDAPGSAPPGESPTRAG